MLTSGISLVPIPVKCKSRESVLNGGRGAVASTGIHNPSKLDADLNATKQQAPEGFPSPAIQHWPVTSVARVTNIHILLLNTQIYAYASTNAMYGKSSPVPLAIREWNHFTEGNVFL